MCPIRFNKEDFCVISELIKPIFYSQSYSTAVLFHTLNNAMQN